MSKRHSYAIGEKAFHNATFIILLILAILIIAPVLLIFISSFTDEKTLLNAGYSFFPKKLSLAAYSTILSQGSSIFHAYGITLLVTSLGTLTSVALTVSFAYPLSRSDFKYRNLFSFIVFFTMLFNGGLVPQYMLWTRYVNIKNTLWALIVPNRLMGAFNIFLVRNYFKNNVPASLIESAKIDGATEPQVFFKIMIPLAKPVIATIALYIGLAYWNDWINGLYYISNSNLFSLQQLLNRLLENIQFLSSNSSTLNLGTQFVFPTTAYRMALAVIGVVPVMVIYPFVQKYLVKGTVIGAVKG